MIELDARKRHEAAVQENLERETFMRQTYREFGGLEELQGPTYSGDSLDAAYKLRKTQTQKEFRIIDRRHIPRGPLLAADVRRQLLLETETG